MASRHLIGLVLAAALVGAPAVARADSGDTSQLICPAPISTCSTVPIPLDPDDPSVLPTPAECPAGYACMCVPSCQFCDDCAAEVCVRSLERECATACDCRPGFGCFEGRCLAGFAPVYCCDANVCPRAQQCQHRDGTMSVCDKQCSEEIWLCADSLEPADGSGGCGTDRDCSCTASCPLCEDCGPGVCIVPGTPTPYRCNDDGSCANPGDRCVCASSCPECDDCALEVCVPGRCDDPMCEERVRKVTRKIGKAVTRASRCNRDRQCVVVDTTTNCVGTCGEFVNRWYRRPLKRYINRLDRRICGTYQSDGCPYATPGCLEQHGECIDRRCVGVPGAD